MNITVKNKCEQLVNVIKNHVENNLAEGTKLLPEAKWAKQLNVNKSTLSKALLQLQKEGYITRKTGVGTIVTYNGKHAVKNIVTAVLFPDLTSTHDIYYSLFFREIAKQTLQVDQMHSVVNIGNDDRRTVNRSRLEQLLRQPQLAGVIVVGPRLEDQETIMALSRKESAPIIWVGMPIDAPGVNYIYIDQYDATLSLLAQAEKAGCRNPALISKTLNTWSRQERHRAFVEKNGDANVYIGAPGENAYQAGYRTMIRLLIGERRPDCILAADKITANGIRQAIVEKGQGRPMPLLTFDYYFDDDQRDVLASAVQPLESMARQAVGYLVKQDFSKPLQVMLKHRILIGAET